MTDSQEIQENDNELELLPKFSIENGENRGFSLKDKKKNLLNRSKGYFFNWLKSFFIMKFYQNFQKTN